MESALAPVSDLTTHTGYRLRMVSNAVSQAFARRLAAEDVTVAEWAVMRVLYDRDAMAPTALAGTMGMTKGAISKLAERLMSKGLIARFDNPEDQRAHRLSLTAEGRAKTPVLAGLADDNDDAFFGVLRDDDRAALRSLLQTLIDRQRLTDTAVD